MSEVFMLGFSCYHRACGKVLGEECLGIFGDNSLEVAVPPWNSTTCSEPDHAHCWQAHETGDCSDAHTTPAPAM